MNSKRENPKPTLAPVAIQFTAPRTVSVVNPFRAKGPPHGDNPVVHLQTQYSAVSPGTELLLYNDEMPRDIPLDKSISSQADSFEYPCLYGYAVVAKVTNDETGKLAPGTRVFAFREHSSHFQELSAALHPIPEEIPSLDAVFIPNVETALSLIMDAAILPGETICVVGQGIVGLLVVATLRRLHPYSVVVTLDINPSRRELSVTAAGAHASLDPSVSDFPKSTEESMPSGADVSIDVSGSGSGLQAAIDVTRDYGRVVIGSWFGTKEVTLPRLGGRFHRSHMSLIASQVSDIPPQLANRWTKGRRLDLAWQLIRDLHPSCTFPIHVASVERAPQVYREIAESRHLQVIFEYEHLTGLRLQ